jgi:hypothetical protein
VGSPWVCTPAYLCDVIGRLGFFPLYR